MYCRTAEVCSKHPPPDRMATLVRIDDTVKQQVQKALTDAWDACEQSCDLASFQIPKDDMSQIYFETLNKNPKYFYVSGRFSMSIDQTTNSISRVNITYNITDPEEIQTKKAEYEAAVSKIIANAQDSWSDAEKALYINDYLARNCSYDNSLQNHSAYDALVTQSAVCEGYALAFLELSQRLELQCEMVSSEQLNHAWNLVKIDDSYYHVDVTWNDPVEDRIGRAMHHYFLKSTDYFKSYKSSSGNGHQADDWVITGNISETASSDKSFDEVAWNSSHTGFDYIGGAWYGFDGSDSICKYIWENDTHSFQKAEELVKITEQWPAENGGYWDGKFVGTGTANGIFYYSDLNTIYELDLNTKDKTTVYTLTEEQKANNNAIYGMHITPEGMIRYILSNNPNLPGTVCVLGDYRIDFDTNGAENGTMKAMEGLMFERDYTLPKNQLTKNGFCFNGWNTAADGSGTAYPDESAFRFASSAVNDGRITLYAQWKEHGETERKDQSEATCTTEGYTGDAYCKDCGELVAKGEKIPMLPHTEVTDEAIAATCTTDGKTQGSHCSVCNTVIHAQETIPAAHDWNTDYTIDQEATGEKPGKKSIHCKNCDAIKDEQEIPKLTPDTSEPNKPGNSSSGNGSSGGNNSGSSSGSNNSGSSSGSNYYPGTWQPGSTGTNHTTAPGSSTTTPGSTTSGTQPTEPDTSASGNTGTDNPPTVSENTAPAPYEYQIVTNATANTDGIFINDSGEIMKNAMVRTADGTKYITDETGQKIVSRLVTSTDGTMYCTQKDGAVAENQTVSVSGHKYFAKENGAVARNEFCTTSYGNTVYATDDGTLASNGIFTANGNKYFAKNSGAVAKSEFCKTKAGNTVYAKADHTLAVNTIVNANGRKYFAKQNGVIAKKAFSTTSKGNRIYSRANGTVVTNKLFRVNGKRYYAKKSGSLAVKTWVTVGSKKYYCNASGVITKVRTGRS